MSDTDNFRNRLRQDAWTAATAQLFVDGWAIGYEAALRDLEKAVEGEDRHDIASKMREQSFGDLRDRAYRERIEGSAKADAALIMAMADVGRQEPQ